MTPDDASDAPDDLEAALQALEAQWRLDRSARTLDDEDE